MNEVINEISKIKGPYTLKSPYHKNKRLPFQITGYSYNDDYPVCVNTVEYKGWQKSDVTGNYKLETVLEFIKTGFIKLKK